MQDEKVDAFGDISLEDVTTADFLCGVDSMEEFFHDEAIVVEGNPITKSYSGGQNYKYTAKQSPAADGDSFKFPVTLRPGTYYFTFFGAKSPDSGKIDWYFGEKKIIPGQNWYAASWSSNQYQYATVNWQESGETWLIGKVNGSSGAGHDINLTKVWFRRK